MMKIDFADFDLSEIFGKPYLAEMELDCCLWLESLDDCCLLNSFADELII